jgi:hypothetical protein
MTEPDLSATWRTVDEALPAEWHLDSLRCASTGLLPTERSEDWIAVAVHDSGQEARHRGATPTEALEGLPASIAARVIWPDPSWECWTRLRSMAQVTTARPESTRPRWAPHDQWIVSVQDRRASAEVPRKGSSVQASRARGPRRASAAPAPS